VLAAVLGLWLLLTVTMWLRPVTPWVVTDDRAAVLATAPNQVTVPVGTEVEGDLVVVGGRLIAAISLTFPTYVYHDRGIAREIEVTGTGVHSGAPVSVILHPAAADTGLRFLVTKRGRVEEAHGGSIFLDEIGELPLTLQAKLLRFLQDREFERLGSTVTRQVDVRIIAATNADLARAVDEGRFREDLYYRLNVFPIKIPPLRERRQDIPLLIEHFLDKFSREYARRLGVAPEALAWLRDYAWPGNVREMENLIERLAIMSDGDSIGLDDLPHRPHPERPAPARPAAAAGVSLDELVKRELLAALERSGWVQSRAARELGVTLRQLNYRLDKFGLTDLVRANRQKTSALGRA